MIFILQFRFYSPPPSQPLSQWQQALGEGKVVVLCTLLRPATPGVSLPAIPGRIGVSPQDGVIGLGPKPSHFLLGCGAEEGK